MALRVQDIETLDKLIEEQDRLSEAISSDRLVLEGIKSEINEAQDKLSWVLSVLQKSDDRKNVVLKEVDALIDEKEGLFVDVNSLKSTIIKLREEVESVKSSILEESSKLLEEKAKIENDILTLRVNNKKDVEAYNAEVLIINSQINSLKSELHNITKNVDIMNSRRIELDGLITDRQNTLNRLNNNYSELLKVDEELKNKVKEVKLTEQKLSSLKLQIKLERENGKNSD